MEKKEQRKKVLAIRFSDQYFQCGFFEDTSPKIIIQKEPLFVAFTQTNVLHFKKALESQYGFCLMNSEEELNKRLDAARGSVGYPVPDAVGLWCEMMIRIIDASINKVKLYDYDPVGIVISIPD